MPAASPTLLWFRQDLRLQDNPALQAALTRGAAIVPVYILHEASEGRWPTGAAARWWLHHSLASLDRTLRERGSRLILARGDTMAVLRQLLKKTGAGSVYWNRRYEPASVIRDRGVQAGLVAAGIETRDFNSALLFEPETITNKQGGPFQVFTPFWRRCLELPVTAPSKLGKQQLPAATNWPVSVKLGELDLLPRSKWATGWDFTWQPGELGAQVQLRKFMAGPMDDYDDERNHPAVDGTSRLSPWLHFGELGPRQVWAAVAARAKGTGVFPSSNGARVFLSEIGWREFAHHLLHHFPHAPNTPMRAKFARFPWASDRGGKKLQAWQRGRTGYPIVDAGMRQLWATGWMHNRVRMIVASFLVKHLRLSWTLGAAWFWDTLVDADLANNTLGWQWSAGCGVDAAPYFRIFAPVLQGRKFDAEGAYVRRWVPELAHLPPEYVHSPWMAPPPVLAAAGVRLGETYPAPVVDHAAARKEALAAWQSLRFTSS